jgi:hypothetical protein
MINFVQSVPTLSCLSIGVISKIVKSLNKIEYIRGQIITQEDLEQLVQADKEGQALADESMKKDNKRYINEIKEKLDNAEDHCCQHISLSPTSNNNKKLSKL